MKRLEEASSKAEGWRELILRQKNSGLTVEAFCRQQGVSGWSFYHWRKRLTVNDPVIYHFIREGNYHAIGE